MGEYRQELDKKERHKNLWSDLEDGRYETNEEKHWRKQFDGGYSWNEEVGDYFERRRKEDKRQFNLEHETTTEWYVDSYRHNFYHV